MAHRRRERAQQYAERRNDERVKRRSEQEQKNRAGDRRADPPMHHELQRQHRRDENDEPVGEHLRQHDFRRHDRHDEQVLDRALLALADQRGTGQDHGEQRDLIDDLRHRRKPRGLQIRIEIRAHDEVDRRAAGHAARH